MVKSKQDAPDVHTADLLAVDTKTLQRILGGCGRNSAIMIGEQANAKVKIGSKFLWNLEKVKRYLNNLEG